MKQVFSILLCLMLAFVTSASVSQTGYLIIRSTPEKADVYLTENGQETYLGQTPIQKEMMYGEYDFRITKNMYYDYNGHVEINNVQNEYACELNPKFGILQLTSVPSGATVTIEGLYGEHTTPCTINYLPSGEHTISLFKENYNAAIRTIHIADGETTILQVPLEANFAKVTIHTAPEAIIYINDAQVGKGIYEEELAEGIYDIEVRLAAHRTMRKQLRVTANKPQVVELNPEPLYGKLEILSNPIGASISLNGQDYGYTPKTINNLRIGDYTLIISKDSCKTVKKTITIEEGKTLNVNERLDTMHLAESYYQEARRYYNLTDYDRAFPLYMKAADMDYYYAHNMIGLFYANGYCVQKDYAEAIKWWTIAAEHGNVGAQCNLGSSYYKGRGVPQDYAQAVNWYTKAAEKGDMQAQNNLANCYYYGRGIPQDYAIAVSWYKKAAEQGYANAQNMLGNCYFRGHGVPQDYTEAVKWYQKAAQQENQAAQHNLGDCYLNGHGVPQDYTEAVKWYRKVAERGQANAQYKLAYCYQNGYGVPQDYTETVKWYKKAAEQGYAGAQYNLGVCYYNGYGVSKNYKEAVTWWKMAAAQGNERAKNILIQLNIKL